MMVSGDPYQGQTITQHARGVLTELLKLLEQSLGHRPRMDEFYPVDVEIVIRTILKWNLTQESQIGFTNHGMPILAKCIFDKKSILLDPNVAPRGPIRNFTLAHEIGHALLHRNACLCSGEAARARSLRRRDIKERTPSEERVEREADIFARELLMPGKAVRAHFKTVFAAEQIWAGSSFATRVWAAGNRDEGSITYEQLRPKEVAPYLAIYKGSPDIISLTEFFGVSRSAMASRLCGLRLVF